MENQNVYNWTIKSGDYHRQNGDYDKLYLKGKKRDKMIRIGLWLGTGFLTSIVFFTVLGYAAGR